MSENSASQSGVHKPAAAVAAPESLLEMQSLDEGWRVLRSVSANPLEASDAPCSWRSTPKKDSSGRFWASDGLKVGIHLGNEKGPLCSLKLIYSCTTVRVIKLPEGGTT